jgi:hypothetical protein
MRGREAAEQPLVIKNRRARFLVLPIYLRAW